MSALVDAFVTNFVEAATGIRFHRSRPIHTDPAVIAAWDEWTPPDRWLTEHAGRPTNGGVL
jgi:hypothetical protein